MLITGGNVSYVSKTLDADMLSSRERSLIDFLDWYDLISREIDCFASGETDTEIATIGTSIADTTCVSQKSIATDTSYDRHDDACSPRSWDEEKEIDSYEEDDATDDDQ